MCYVCLQHDTDPDGNVVVKVTLDNVVIEVMAGAKALQQLNVDIPDAAMQILKQVWKINVVIIYPPIIKYCISAISIKV